ncbi:MAG TPA: hypothetical protein VM031_01870 [Phycisphaerae bacterium]|nr:hypothetical protein [Phycisphaerae bacterium]
MGKDRMFAVDVVRLMLGTEPATSSVVSEVKDGKLVITRYDGRHIDLFGKSVSVPIRDENVRVGDVEEALRRLKIELPEE